MARFKETDNVQGQFMAVNLKEQLLPDTFEWAVDYMINNADMSLFEERYDNDKRGACAYPPRILLKIIIYCYSRGIITSKRIEKACRENRTRIFGYNVLQMYEQVHAADEKEGKHPMEAVLHCA